MDARPVLYLDVDDTLIDWSLYRAKPARGVREFLLWARENCEVRWLTRRCPGGEMPGWLVEELSELLGVEAEWLQPIRGVDWEGCGSKLNGIAWLEHLVLGRPFLWVEDENGVGERELEFLAAQELHACYHHCNVSMAPDSLARVHQRLTGGASPVRPVAPPAS